MSNAARDGAIWGATAGSIVPGVGTAVGGLVGGLTGWIVGGIQERRAEERRRDKVLRDSRRALLEAAEGRVWEVDGDVYTRMVKDAGASGSVLDKTPTINLRTIFGVGTFAFARYTDGKKEGRGSGVLLWAPYGSAQYSRVRF